MARPARWARKLGGTAERLDEARFVPARRRDEARFVVSGDARCIAWRREGTEAGGAGLQETMNLPQTDFPMRANLVAAGAGVARSSGTSIDVYRAIARGNARRRRSFVLHDGPPYANGHIHMGTAYNKVLKDLIVKYKTMRGFRAPYVPGLGLPRPADRAPGREEARPREDGADLARPSCARCAASGRWSSSDVQREEFKRLGVRGDWDDPYLTLKPALRGGQRQGLQEDVPATARSTRAASRSTGA